jgi:uncharacterized membrane-anchored protein YhcB (DUF1043 family)
MTSFTISGWTDLAVLIGMFSLIAGIIGGAIRSRLDRRSAEEASSDRLIRLVEAEAEKRVEIVRTEFKLQIAELTLAHRTEIDAMRSDFEKEFKSLKSEHDTYRCELAPVCGWRNKKIAPPAPVVG